MFSRKINYLLEGLIVKLNLDSIDPFFLVSLRMFLLCILLYVNDISQYQIIVPLLVLPGLLLKEITLSKYYWFIVVLFLSYFYLYLGLENYVPNHKYIYAYFSILIAVVLFVKDKSENYFSIFTESVRWIIGLVFLLATIGKFLAPEFLDGSFFYFTTLTDPRFYGFTSTVVGISQDSLWESYFLFDSLIHTSNPSTTVTLESNSFLVKVSYFLSYWTIFIEGMIGISFLLPLKTFVSKYREWFLIIFVFTTYPIATVPGFAIILANLAFIQSRKENKASFYSLFYLAIFLIIPIFRIPFLKVLELLF